MEGLRVSPSRREQIKSRIREELRPPQKSKELSSKKK
jgi:hypothetical protein